MGMTPAIQSLGSKIAAQKQRAKAIARYYEKPNHCLHCGVVIQIREGEKISDTRVKKFCNRSCAGSYNNLLYPKRHKTNQCVSCEEFILAGTKFCSAQCRKKPRNPNRNVTSPSTLFLGGRKRSYAPSSTREDIAKFVATTGPLEL